MGPRIGRRVRRLLLLLSAAVACGGQSGNEGDLPAPPCAYDQAVVVGRIEELGAGTVGVRVDRLVEAGGEMFGADGGVVFDGQPTIGSLLRGGLGTMYSWNREFTSGENVVALVSWNDDRLSLQLMPFERDRAEVQWGRAGFELTLDEMIALECPTKLQAEHGDAVGSDVIENTSCTVGRIGGP